MVAVPIARLSTGPVCLENNKSGESFFKLLKAKLIWRTSWELGVKPRGRYLFTAGSKLPFLPLIAKSKSLFADETLYK
jgi:hypothetical protein